MFVNTPYMSFLRARSCDTAPPKLDWAIANKNYYVAESRIDRPAQERAVRAALEAYDARPGSDTAKTLYDSLAIHKWLAGMYSEQRIHTLGNGLSVSTSTINMLLKIADETPHRVVFVNAVTWLLALSRDLDQEFLCIAGFDSALTDAIWCVCEASESEAATIQRDALRFSFAKAHSFEARHWLCDQINNEPSDELRGSVLRYAFSDTSPEAIELYGEPNPKFAPALIDFVKKTKLLEELEAETIDDALCRAALGILSEGVCNSLLDGIDFDDFERTISIGNLLSLMIGHMEGRALSLNELFDLAWIYDCVFEETDRWLNEDPVVRGNPGNLVIGRREHQELAKRIRDVYENPENKNLLDAVAQSGGIDGRNAKISLNRINQVPFGTRRDDFDELLGELQDRLARGANENNVPITGFEDMIEATNGDTRSVERAIEWCEDYLACMGGSGPNLTGDAQRVLQHALPLLKSRHLGLGLMSKGLESTTHHSMAMAILDSYPVDRWPETVEQSLRRGLGRSEISVEVFKRTIEKLAAHKTDK